MRFGFASVGGCSTGGSRRVGGEESRRRRRDVRRVGWRREAVVREGSGDRLGASVF